MDKKVKFAVIGCGRISRNHIDAITYAPHADLIAVCDIVEECARETAKKYGVQSYYTDIDTMIECEKPDVCCICTPSGLHAECNVKLGGIFQRRLFKGSAAIRDAVQKGLVGKIILAIYESARTGKEIVID